MHGYHTSNDSKNEGGNVFEMKVKCPRCGRIWIVPQGIPDITCNCHLYCEDGDKPSDCSISEVNFSGQLGVYKGLHTDADDNSDDIMHLTYYCSIHNKYSKKVPITIECDWDNWYSKRAPHDLRMSHGEY